MKNLILASIVLILASCSNGLPDYSKVEPVTQEELNEINKNSWDEIRGPIDSMIASLTDEELLILCCQEYEIKYPETIKEIQANRPENLQAFLTSDPRFIKICNKLGLDPFSLPGSYFGDETTENK